MGHFQPTGQKFPIPTLLIVLKKIYGFPMQYHIMCLAYTLYVYLITAKKTARLSCGMKRTAFKTETSCEV